MIIRYDKLELLREYPGHSVGGNGCFWSERDVFRTASTGAEVTRPRALEWWCPSKLDKRTSLKGSGYEVRTLLGDGCKPVLSCDWFYLRVSSCNPCACQKVTNWAEVAYVMHHALQRITWCSKLENGVFGHNHIGSREVFHLRDVQFTSEHLCSISVRRNDSSEDCDWTTHHVNVDFSGSFTRCDSTGELNGWGSMGQMSQPWAIEIFMFMMKGMRRSDIYWDSMIMRHYSRWGKGGEALFGIMAF